MSYRNYSQPSMMLPGEHHKQPNLFGNRHLNSEDLHQVNSNPFQRQDSLALASSLQEKDRERYQHNGMLEFLETSLDLDQYLQTLEELDVPADQIDLNDDELQKAHLIYDQDTYENYDPYAHNEDLVPQHRAESVVSTVSSYDAASGATPLSHIDSAEQPGGHALAQTRNPNLVKMEPDWDENMPSTSSSGGAISRRRSRDPNDELRSFTPATKARKYTLKAPTEKANPHYQLKRARNNDAVRKSRTKAKEIQDTMKKENQDMHQRIIELESTIAAMKKTEKQDKELIRQMMQKIDQCNCNAQKKLLRH